MAKAAEARPDKDKKEDHHPYIYDDETIESMVRYYRVEENFESFLRYIKNRGIPDEEIA